MEGTIYFNKQNYFIIIIKIKFKKYMSISKTGRQRSGGSKNSFNFQVSFMKGHVKVIQKMYIKRPEIFRIERRSPGARKTFGAWVHPSVV